MISKGMDARKSAENVYMPMHMREGQEMYGQLESHVKQVYNGRVGWMGNDVYDINPLAVKEETTRMVGMMGGALKVTEAAAEAVKQGGFENWSWALKLTSMLLELDQDNLEIKKVRADAARALGQRTASANARGFYITEALAMENKLKLGDQPVSLEAARALLGTPGVEQLMVTSLEDVFQYVRYLINPRKAEDMRLTFTVAVDDAPLQKIELRNGVVIISPAASKQSDHIDVTLREWSEFVVGQRSFASRNKVVATFESVLERAAAPAGTEQLDEQLDKAVDAAEYVCDGGGAH
jgi:alkyl sulfatase BDS1-like metallo-beta-lactamase superfamily hydrolase